MRNEKKEIKKFFWLFFTFIAFLMTSPVLWGEQPDKGSERNWEGRGEYVLMVKGDHISLKAKNASLKDVLEDIGRRMNIDVVAKIPREDKISIELDMIYLEDAIKRFKTSYAYISKSKQETGKITKIVVVPKGMEHMLPDKHGYDSQPQASHVSPGYDPQPPIQKYEPGHQSTIVRPDYESSSSSDAPKNEPQTPYDESEYNSQRPLVGSDNNSQSAVVGSENNPESSDVEFEYNTQPPDVPSEYNPQPSIMEKK